MTAVSSGGGEPDCGAGFGGISSLSLASGLRGKGACWDASWMDMVATVLSYGVFHFQPRPIRGQALRAEVNVSMSPSPDKEREKKIKVLLQPLIKPLKLTSVS